MDGLSVLRSMSVCVGGVLIIMCLSKIDVYIGLFSLQLLL